MDRGFRLFWFLVAKNRRNLALDFQRDDTRVALIHDARPPSLSTKVKVDD